MAHYLAIADARLQLIEAERAGALTVITVEIEPTSWRTFTGVGGALLKLKPDMALVIHPPIEDDPNGSIEDHWFVEVDRGTESLPTLLRQCRVYEAYRASGREQLDRGVFPLVLWVVPDARRRDRLQAAIQQSRDLTNALYRVTTDAELLSTVLQGAA